MKSLTLLLAAAISAAPAAAQRPSKTDVARWQREAQRTTIIRDDWGIAHVYGTTDADAVFGMIYAQAEDDFNRIETNYLTALGRMAEAQGENALGTDLRQKLYVNPDSMKKQYAMSPAWLKALMNAWADGLNYYLYTHPQVKPLVLTHFEPWLPLTFPEGSIGGDIERINPFQLLAFYNGDPGTHVSFDYKPRDGEPSGSNGVAIAPANTRNHHALLLINPHTSFFFRSELQMVSGEGLNAYGAATWGQFFIYQGFNPHQGWMHTSSGVDNIDEFSETVTKKDGRFYYKYGNEERPITVETIKVPYKTPAGMSEKTFTVYRTHHGPVVRELNGKWISVSLMQKPIAQLEQSYLRTKANGIQAFEKIMERHSNSSNNTVYADAAGDIAYFHSNFIPRRDNRFDYTKPVDGSDPATDWQGVLSISESPNVINPKVGWLYNSNNWPWSAAGPDSPRRENFPTYVETGRAETARGEHALIVLPNKHDFTIQSLIDAAYDSYLPYFADNVPALLKAYDELSPNDETRAKLKEQIAVLRSWDYRWSVNSIATSLAVYWGEEVMRGTPDPVVALANASDKLTADFGTWQKPWGEINRFQRLTGDIVQSFNDAAPSIPVAFTSSVWGSLASFGARAYPGTKKRYGTSGNSFVAVVEFGDSVRARAVTAGGESGHPDSPHFNDEATRYATGNLRDVYFYRSQLKGHTERSYHPGH